MRLDARDGKVGEEGQELEDGPARVDSNGALVLLQEHVGDLRLGRSRVISGDLAPCTREHVGGPEAEGPDEVAGGELA